MPIKYRNFVATGGFTLIEMAMVLLIIGLVLGGLLPTISTQQDQQRVSETRKLIKEIKDALLGYAIANSRFPCPASSTSHGVESFDIANGGNAANGKCSNFYDGFLPAATLGIFPTNDQGYSVDSWNNQIHYAITQSDSKAFTSLNGMKTVGISGLGPDLLVCSVASTSSSTCSVANSALTSSPGVPVVIYSIGKNGSYAGSGSDEAENPNPNSADNDRIFVSHSQSSSFDDLVDWISPNILYNRMVTAGKLP